MNVLRSHCFNTSFLLWVFLFSPPFCPALIFLLFVFNSSFSLAIITILQSSFLLFFLFFLFEYVFYLFLISIFHLPSCIYSYLYLFSFLFPVLLLFFFLCILSYYLSSFLPAAHNSGRVSMGSLCGPSPLVARVNFIYNVNLCEWLSPFLLLFILFFILLQLLHRRASFHPTPSPPSPALRQVMLSLPPVRASHSKLSHFSSPAWINCCYIFRMDQFFPSAFQPLGRTDDKPHGD